MTHGLRTPREEIAFTAPPKIHSHSQIFRYGRSIFCMPQRPNFSDIFNLCLHWVSVIRGHWYWSGKLIFKLFGSKKNSNGLSFQNISSENIFPHFEFRCISRLHCNCPISGLDVRDLTSQKKQDSL